MDDEGVKNKVNYLPQFIAAFSATLGAVSVGSTLGFSSPAGLQLIDGNHTLFVNDTTFDDNEIHEVHVFDDTFTLTEDQMAWVSSIVSVGALWGGLAGGTALNVFGRRGTMMASLIPAFAGWMLIALAINFSMLVVGRLMTGVFVGLTCISVNTYIGEIASPSIRGMLGTFFQLMVNFGFLLSYGFGVVLHWYYLAFLCDAVPILFAVAMFFNKESPSYLLMKGKEAEARDALQYFRGSSFNIEAEIQAMKYTQYQAQKHKVHITTLLTTPYIMRPFGISIGLMFFQQFSGANAVLFNLSTIFKSAGTDMSESVSSIIIGGVFVFGTFVGSFLIDRMGRKVLLTTSALMMCFSQLGLGCFFYMMDYHEKWTLENLQWLPLLSLVVYMLGFAIGFAPIPWLMMGELFSSNVREMASSVATATNWFFSFAVTVSFEAMQDLLYDFGVFWTFSIICFLGALFSIFVVKETKGKTLDEITEMFGGPKAGKEDIPADEEDGTTNQLLADAT